MCVQIDKARRNQLASGIDCAGCLNTFKITDAGNTIAIKRYISAPGLGAGAINNVTTANNQFMRHKNPPQSFCTKDQGPGPFGQAANQR